MAQAVGRTLVLPPMGAVVVTVMAGFAGYLVTYLNNLRLTQRQERLARVNRQLSEFYGPLLALVEVNSRLYHTFSEKHPRPEGREPLSHRDEQDAWRLWITTVFLPTHRAIRDLVNTKADLMDEADMPPLLLEVYAHAAWHELSAAKWEAGDLTIEHPPRAFPATAIRAYARENFARLKSEQAALLGRRLRQSRRTVTRRR